MNRDSSRVGGEGGTYGRIVREDLGFRVLQSDSDEKS